MFGFGKEKAEAKALAPQFLRIAKDCANICNKTTNPEVFFNRYNEMIEMMEKLSGFEKYVRFSGEKPHVQLKKIVEGREQQITLFIGRSYQKAKEEATEKATDRGEKATIERFFSRMEKYYDQMTDGNIEHIQNLKRSAF